MSDFAEERTCDRILFEMILIFAELVSGGIAFRAEAELLQKNSIGLLNKGEKRGRMVIPGLLVGALVPSDSVYFAAGVSTYVRQAIGIVL